MKSLKMKSILADEAKELIESKQCHLLIDVRSPAEYRASHIEGSINIPMDHLEEGMLAKFEDKDTVLYMMCSCGNRSSKACTEMESIGYQNVISVDGGIIELKRLGMKVIEEEHHVISIERQVRIVAGSLVLTGVLVGYFISPSFLAISAFVGAGLIFAGITNTCGLGVLLARMPWNR
jgi:rhodanese-related sulfurtransferase